MNEGGYWVSTENISGECGVVNVSTLKRDDYSWKYSSQGLSPLRMPLMDCLPARIEERKISHRSLAKEHDVNCKEIKFSWLP